MNRGGAQRNGLSSAAVPIPLPAGFEVTWAGPLPLGRVFCFGSEEGKLVVTNENGKILQEAVMVSMSGEAINGVAVSGMWLAAATRDDMTFLRLALGAKGEREGFTYPHGAHGISTSPSGYFIAAMGRTGIMAAAPPFALSEPITVYGGAKTDFYNYRAACLPAPMNVEVLIAALRLGGLGYAAFFGASTEYVMNTASLEGFDAVDFCPLFPATDSLPVAVLGRDRRLVLFKDLLTDKNPLIFDFKTIQGSAYRVLSCHGDVYVVTSKGIFMLAELANAFLAGPRDAKIETQILVMPMQAVDANLCGDEWLLVVTADGVYKLDVRALHESRPEDVPQNLWREAPSAVTAADWKWRDFRQGSKTLAGAAG